MPVVRSDVIKPIDVTGTSPDNLISNEAHTLSPTTPQPLLVPKFGAFFKESLVIVDTDNNAVVAPSTFMCMDLDEDATRKSGKEVFTSIFFEQRPVGAHLSVTYQAYGGDFNRNAGKLIEWLQERQVSGGQLSWDDIPDAPKRFAPAAHKQHIKDLYGMEYLVEALARLSQAAETGSDPVWQQLMAQITNKLSQVRASANAALAEQIETRMDWVRVSSGAHHIGLGLLQDLQLMSRIKARTVVNPAYDHTLDSTNNYLSIDGLVAAGEGIYDNSVMRSETHLDEAQGHVAAPTRPTLLSMVAGQVIVFPTKQSLFDVGDSPEQDTFPKGFPDNDRLIVTRTAINAEDRGGVYLGWSPETHTLWLCLMRGEHCRSRFEWRKIHTEGDLEPVMEFIDIHTNDHDNPHKDTKDTIGLDLIENLGVVTEEEILSKKSVRKLLTHERLIYGMMAHMINAKPKPEPGEELDPNARTMDQAQIIFTKCKESGSAANNPNIPKPQARGQLVTTFCDGTDRFARYTDGAGSFYDEVLELNSDDCGYVAKPASGTLLSKHCQGIQQIGKYADGAGGFYEEVLDSQSTECGYVAPPAAGTVLSTFCSGTTKMTRYADGAGGYTDTATQNNAPDCGYVAPTPAPSYPAAGTKMSEKCIGTDRYGVFANGSGGTYDSIILVNAPDCGYTTPAPTSAPTPAPTTGPFTVKLTTNGTIFYVNETVTNLVTITNGEPNTTYEFVFERRFQDWTQFYEVSDIQGFNATVLTNQAGSGVHSASWMYTNPAVNTPGRYDMQFKTRKAGTSAWTTTNMTTIVVIGTTR